MKLFLKMGILFQKQAVSVFISKLQFTEIQAVFKFERYFELVINDDFFHITLCNPPFHASMDQVTKSNQRKWRNLGKGNSKNLNFGGQNAELWTPGGEVKFIANMIEESKIFSDQVLWFSSLVSKKDNLEPLTRALGKARVADHKIVEMAQGQKVSRFLAWSFVKVGARSLFFKENPS